ncbi:hypothetical protein [Methylotenera sp.]|uniref:hypothetical protein n=1 Tax=Methylotenera sp. TaxID=2051956 RepID=UPI00273346B3|nr:hypothetical protein [Methylotenera sp.]MDP3777649.1 hypothetical protein [Methylotenera sp.]
MEAATFFMLFALIGAFLAGLYLSTSPKLSAAICGVAPIILLIGIFVIRSPSKIIETLLFVSPFLVAAGIMYSALGYFGAVLGNQQRIKKQESIADVKSLSQPKRSAWLYLAFLIILPVFMGLIGQIILWVTRLFKHVFP